MIDSEEDLKAQQEICSRANKSMSILIKAMKQKQNRIGNRYGTDQPQAKSGNTSG